MKYSFIFLGAIFGFLLSRAGATTYDFYAGLFLFKEFQLLWVIIVAVLVSFIGFLILRKSSGLAVLTKEAFVFEKKPMKKGLIVGALLFGMGWGLAGSCPGTAPAMLGEGKIMAGFSILGIIIGTYLYGVLNSRNKP